MAGRSEQYATAPDGRTLCFAEWGSRAGTPVFHLHGSPGSRLLGRRRIENDLEGLLVELDVRLITYDRPGYGRSDRLRGHTVADGVADVLAIADALGVDHFAVDGVSAGAPYALAVAALAPDRVGRVTCVAPLGPRELMGEALWSKDQDPLVQELIGWVLEGEARAEEMLAREDAEARAGLKVDDPLDAADFEANRNGVLGWVDDEIALLKPWGFELVSVTAPVQAWYDPNDTALPPQHPAWIAHNIHGAEMVVTGSLGHGSPGNPRPDWRRLYSWLASA
ncbi:MAG: alpha/beta fold hydrolase [Candidatus Dormibacteria bacterium]